MWSDAMYVFAGFLALWLISFLPHVRHLRAHLHPLTHVCALIRNSAQYSAQFQNVHFPWSWQITGRSVPIVCVCVWVYMYALLVLQFLVCMRPGTTLLLWVASEIWSTVCVCVCHSVCVRVRVHVRVRMRTQEQLLAWDGNNAVYQEDRFQTQAKPWRLDLPWLHPMAIETRGLSTGSTFLRGSCADSTSEDARLVTITIYNVWGHLICSVA